MRGLRLFIRPIEPADREAVDAFVTAARQSTYRPVDSGLLAKLLGDIVAVTFVEEERDVLRVRLLLVAETFRRKWIGRTMLAELEQLAKKLNKHSIVVDGGDAAGAEEFLRRTGFHGEGERWVRVVP